MKKLFFMFSFLFVFVGMSMAQSQKATGLVLSAEDNEPIIGATVLVKGTTQGSITDLSGAFSIENIEAGAKVLQVSYIGKRTVEVPIKSYQKIVLHNEAQALDEVVVTVAYGTAKKSSLTGAISSINKEQIEIRPVSNVTSALEGTTSGVQINSSYGSPGSSPDIRIRGVGTVNGSTSPLYVVDGMPMGGDIADLNPSDIESISVLKDAASCALYGNRASNGVVLITTKKGTSSKLSLDLKMNQGSYTRGIKEYDLMNPYQFMEASWQNLRNTTLLAGKMNREEAGAYASENLINDYLYLNIFNKADNQLFDANGRLVPGAQVLPGYAEDLDWYDAAIRHGYRQEYNISGNAATAKSNYYFSVGYLDEDGYVKNSSFDRFTARTVINLTPKKWLSTGLTLNGSHQNFKNTNGDSDGGYTNAFMFCRNIAPIYPVHLHNPDGSYRLDPFGNKQYDPGEYRNDEGDIVHTRNQFTDRHVIWENELNKDKTTRNTLQGILYADIKFLKDFTLSLKGDMNLSNEENRTYNSAVIGDGKGNNGRAKRKTYRRKSYTIQEQLRWNHAFGDHFVDVLVGHENYYKTYDYMYGFKTTEVFAGKPFLSNFKEITSLEGYQKDYRTESYLGRVRYNYKEKYNLEVSFRRDGSSRFHPDNRWGNFGSVGANWMITEEEFMKPYTWVNSLKLRANYGQVGNDAGADYYAYMQLYENSQNANKGAYYLNQYEAKDLKWETGESFGFAVEGRFFNRWNLSMEYFDKRNKDLVFNVYLPLSAGANVSGSAEASIAKNIGTISNRGFEINTDVDIFKNKDWKVNFATNATFLKNKVTKLPEQNKDGIIEGIHKIVEGKSRYEYYMYTFEGIDQMTGNSLYKVNTEDYSYTNEAGATIGNTEGGDITEKLIKIGDQYYVDNVTYAQKEFHGSALPTLYGSFSPTVNFKSFTLSALFTYSLGGKTYDGVYKNLMSAGSAPYGMHTDAMSSWNGVPAGMTEDSPNRIDRNGFPQINSELNDNNYATSNRWLTSSNYLVLKNLTFNYRLPQSWVKYLDLQAISVSFSCENLFTLTARQGMNPQQSFSGGQSNKLVTPRVFTFGLNVKL